MRFGQRISARQLILNYRSRLSPPAGVLIELRNGLDSARQQDESKGVCASRLRASSRRERALVEIPTGSRVSIGLDGDFERLVRRNLT